MPRPRADLHVADHGEAVQLGGRLPGPGRQVRHRRRQDARQRDARAGRTSGRAAPPRRRDVIHSFFIPTVRFKQDAVPGREIVQWFEVTKPGKYEMPVRRAVRVRPLRHEGLDLRAHARGVPSSGRQGERGLSLTAGPGRTEASREGGKDTMSPERDGHARTTSHEHHELGLRPHVHLLDRSQDDRPAVPVHGPVHDDDRRLPGDAGALAARWPETPVPGLALAPSETGGHHPARDLQHGCSPCTPPS